MGKFFNWLRGSKVKAAAAHVSKEDVVKSDHAFRSERGQERRARLVTSRKPQCLRAASTLRENRYGPTLAVPYIQKVCRKRPSGLLKP